MYKSLLCRKALSCGCRVLAPGQQLVESCTLDSCVADIEYHRSKTIGSTIPAVAPLTREIRHCS